MFSDEFAWGFPPAVYALKAYLALLDEVAPGAPWMVAGLGVDISPLFGAAVARDGHLRVGLEDARFGEKRSNLQMVEEAVRQVRAGGREPASAADVRRACEAIDKTRPELRRTIS
jgi:uncharacterized protein (DUF849 family)